MSRQLFQSRKIFERKTQKMRSIRLSLGLLSLEGGELLAQN